jgi:hypothetical protein
MLAAYQGEEGDKGDKGDPESAGDRPPAKGGTVLKGSFASAPGDAGFS